MRMYEIIRLQAKPPPPRATVQASTRAKIQKAREKTLKAAQTYNDQRQADDDAERDALRNLASQ